MMLCHHILSDNLLNGRAMTWYVFMSGSSRLFHMQHVHRPPSTWPDAGALELRDVQLRYRPGLPLSLRGLNAYVKPGERVGVVGRTVCWLFVGENKETPELAQRRKTEVELWQMAKRVMLAFL